jgi:hypothetical protein
MTQAAPRAKKRRQKQTSRDILAHIVMASWICVVLQGALRKWVFPGMAILYLIQDVPLLIAYIYALWKGLVWGGKLAWVCIVIAIVISIQTMLQLILLSIHLRTAVIGLHHYIFYLPILFIAPVSFNFKHRLRFVRWNLIAIVPMAMIATLQSRSPKGAWINRTSAGDDTAMGLAGDTVRATGTFNFTAFYSIWCGIATALVVGEWLMPPGRRSFKSKILLLVCTLSAVLATMVSGSRSAVALSALGFMGGFAAVIVTRNVRLIVRFAAVLVLLPILTVVAALVSPASFNAVLDRFSGEANEQSLNTRVQKILLGFTYSPAFSVLGVGIGYGIPAANPSAGAAVGILLSENEPIRLVQEMGSFTGTGLVLIRYVAGFLLIGAGFKALLLRRGHSFPHALPMAFSLAPTLMVGEIVRSAPVMATQVFICAALILGAILFRQEPLQSAPAQLSATR